MLGISFSPQKSKENNENDMTSVVWAGTVFGPCLWPLSARRHSFTVQYTIIPLSTLILV